MKIIFRNIFLLLAELVLFAYTERLKTRIYEDIYGSGCFRRLNGTHQVGCSSKYSGATGVIHVISSTTDLDFVIESPRVPPYIVVMPPHLFTRDNVLKLRDVGGNNITGIVIINQVKQMKHFSQELKCPNQYSSIKQQTCDENKPETIWNPYGTGLMLENFKFPIYYVSDNETVKNILGCFEKFNNFNKEDQFRRSLCSMQIITPMSATGNSEICLRRSESAWVLYPTKYCEPLEGSSIFATLYPRTHINELNSNEIDAKENFILLTARIDTASMFEGLGLGASDSLVSFATLLNIGHILSRILPEKNLSPNKKGYNVIFMFLNGESYDYIGSQRFVYDLKQLHFPRNNHRRPISWNQIKLMIDIGTLDNPNDIKVLVANEIPEVNNFKKLLNSYSKRFNLNINFDYIETLNLPPTSAQSFLRENLTFPAAILNSKPLNKFYHSIYDGAYNIGYKYLNKSSLYDFTELMDSNRALEIFDANSIQIKIRNVSSVISFALYEILTDSEYYETKLGNPLLVDEFLYCFLESASCPLFKAASHPKSLPALPIPPPRYISVHRAFKDTTNWTYRLLGFLISQKLPKISKENCTVLPLHYFAGYNNTGECRLTTQNFTIAVSPAFSDSNYNWKSGNYSTWTESTWNAFSARIYIRPSKIHETLILTIGIVVFILSFVLTYLISSRSEVLFESVPITNGLTEPAAC